MLNTISYTNITCFGKLKYVAIHDKPVSLPSHQYLYWIQRLNSACCRLFVIKPLTWAVLSKSPLLTQGQRSLQFNCKNLHFMSVFTEHTASLHQAQVF